MAEDIYQFKRELQSYKAYKAEIADLRKDIEDIDTQMVSVRSPAIGGVHGNPTRTRDQRLLDLMEKKAEIEAMIRALEILLASVDRKLAKLTKEERDILMMIYSEHVTVEKMARTYYVSYRQMYRWILALLTKAVQ